MWTVPAGRRLLTRYDTMSRYPRTALTDPPRGLRIVAGSAKNARYTRLGLSSSSVGRVLTRPSYSIGGLARR